MQIRRQGWATLLSSTCTRAVKHGGLWMSVQPPDCKAELMARTEQGHARERLVGHRQLQQRLELKMRLPAEGKQSGSSS